MVPRTPLHQPPHTHTRPNNNSKPRHHQLISHATRATHQHHTPHMTHGHGHNMWMVYIYMVYGMATTAAHAHGDEMRAAHIIRHLILSSSYLVAAPHPHPPQYAPHTIYATRRRHTRRMLHLQLLVLPAAIRPRRPPPPVSGTDTTRPRPHAECAGHTI